MAHKTAIVCVVADTHTNSTAGLLPPEVRRDDGSTHRANDRQLWLWDQWRDLWRHVRKLKKKHKARVIGVFDGDGPDRNRHSGGYDLIAASRADIVRWTVASLEPMAKACNTLIINRGTPAHEGGTGELAELVAQQLDTMPDPATGNATWWWPELVIEGVRFVFGHRPISSSYREHTRGAGAQRTAHDLEDAYYRMGDPVPDVAVFAHVHHWEDSGQNRKLRAVYCPPWKLCDSYGHSLGMSGKIEPVGAWVFVVRDGHYTAELWKRQWHRAGYVEM